MSKIYHPSHYNQGIEVLDFIESWKLDFVDGNIIKYVVRAKYKDNELEDLEKALFYLTHRIEKLKLKIQENQSNIKD